MIWIIGDIHGMLDPLVRLISATKMKEAMFGKKISKFIFLGDYIDHGPNSKQVIDYLIDLDYEKVFLAGNHEDMFIQFYNETEYSKLYRKNWFETNGIRETIDSFGVSPKIQKKLYFPKIFRFNKEEEFEPKDFRPSNIYFNFLNNLTYSHKEELKFKNETLKFAFVHAGLSKTHNIEKQLNLKTYSEFHKFLEDEKMDMNDSTIWTRNISDEKFGEYILVNGHSPTILINDFKTDNHYRNNVGYPYLKFTNSDVFINKSKYFRYNISSSFRDLISINIDTGAVYGGYLTAIGISEKTLEQNEIIVLQVNVGGNHRNRADIREFYLHFNDV